MTTMAKVSTYLGLFLVLCIHSVSDSTGPKDQLGPNGEDCMKREIQDSYYNHTDENGHHCPCTLCRSGNVLYKNCTCDPNNLDRPQDSECGPVSRGQFMNSSNFCTQGFECKKCLHPLKVKENCSLHGPDTVCTCVDDHHMTLPDTCMPNPKCDAGYEALSGHGDHGTEIRCTPCREGYFQPKYNSVHKCKRIRQCTLQEGTSRSDAVCLNNLAPPPIIKPTNDAGYVTSKKTTESDKRVTTPTPTSGSDETTSVLPTTRLTTHDPGCPPDLRMLTWLLCLISFVFGIAVGFFIYHAYARRGAYILPRDQNQINNGLEDDDAIEQINII